MDDWSSSRYSNFQSAYIYNFIGGNVADFLKAIGDANKVRAVRAF